MKSPKFLAVIAVAGVAIAGFLVWKQFSAPRVNLRPSAAVGEVVADEATKLLGGKGTVVLVSREPPKDGPDANGEKIDSFKTAIRQRNGIKLHTSEWLTRPPVGTMDTGVASQEELLAALEKNGEANALILLAGLPPLSPALQEKFKAVKLLAVCGYSVNVKRWLESKSLAVVVVPRFSDPPADAPPPKTPREWFDREYQLFTPETISLLPY